MSTPILDFLRSYSEEDAARFHMPGHKGESFIGPESWDITEVSGADSLYEAEGIIAESEQNATALFGSQRTVYSTEGSSQCIRAMLHLLISNRKSGAGRCVLAARNAHKAFIYAAALLDFDIHWLYPETSGSICACTISPEGLDKALSRMDELPAAVYITSPDYLGNLANISALAEVCHRWGTYLAVDNAHGAYLHFLPQPAHPLNLGADICCDSAHKTLPVLTGGAYLHIGRSLPESFARKAKSAMALFGSTSPSYLIMASLDSCNEYIERGYRQRLADFLEAVDGLKSKLCADGWIVEESDPLRLTLRATENLSGKQLYRLLREKGIEAEFADDDYIVFMLTPNNSPRQLEKLYEALRSFDPGKARKLGFSLPEGEKVLTVRQAIMAESEIIKTSHALGRICASPMVSCPPAIPIAISGERITAQAIELFEYYNIEEIEVVSEPE